MMISRFQTGMVLLRRFKQHNPDSDFLFEPDFPVTEKPTPDTDELGLFDVKSKKSMTNRGKQILHPSAKSADKSRMKLTLESASEYKLICLTVGTQRFCAKN
jgi:hypothetical protein